MITFQDLIEAGENIRDKMTIVERAIAEHKSSAAYRTALEADMYYAHLNPTIMKYEKYIHDMLGRVKDTISANHKIASRYYFFFITQLVQYLLSNGVTFTQDSTKEKIKNFDEALSELATKAQNHGVSYGFFNFDKIDVFSMLEFVPFFDEENGSIKAGARFWQIADDKPLRVTLYEEDGFTEFIKRSGEDYVILKDKQAYIKTLITSDASGTEIFDGENYPSFPIVPLYNINKQSEIVGNKGTIDAYDLVSSKMTNNISEGDLIYWIISNADGMSPADDQKFLEMIHTQHVAHADEGQITAHNIEIPHEATDAALERLKRQLFDDFMAFDPTSISAGNVTATQITAAYQQLDNKADMFEFQVINFIKGILVVAGIEDEPSFKRNRIANASEETQVLLSAATVLDTETIIDKLPILTPEEAKIAKERAVAEEAERTYIDEREDSGEGDE